MINQINSKKITKESNKSFYKFNYNEQSNNIYEQGAFRIIQTENLFDQINVEYFSK